MSYTGTIKDACCRCPLAVKTCIVSSLSLVGHKQQVFVSQSSTIHMDRHLVLGSQDNCQKRDNRRDLPSVLEDLVADNSQVFAPRPLR